MWLVVIAVFAVLSGSTVGLVPTASAANTFLTNPLGFAYQNETNVSLYGHPTGMLVTGRCNRYNVAFTDARAAGAEVLAYLQPNDRPDIEGCALDTGFYLGRPSDVPLWPFPTPGHRVGFQGTHMTDMRAGSSWILHVVSYVENLMREDKVDGVFLDVIGGRLWNSLAGWDPSPGQSDPWTQQEKDEWTKGSIDLVRRLDASRQAINPNFIIVNNNNWSRVEKDGRQDQLGRDGEKYVDGICLEHHSINEPFSSWSG